MHINNKGLVSRIYGTQKRTQNCEEKDRQSNRKIKRAKCKNEHF